MAESLTPFYTQIDRMKVDRNDIRERRRRYLVRWTSIKAERGRQWPKWIDLADHFLPERGRFLATDHNAPKQTSKIQNNSTTRYARALAAGLMSGVTSPARPWFNLTLPDPDMAEWGPVRQWLYTYNQRMRLVFELSGFYKAMAMGQYPDLGVFGTACTLVEEDPLKVMRFIPLAIGSYGLAQNGRGEIDCIIYEEPWTVGELVDEFGWENCSPSVRTTWNSGLYEQYVLVLRVIEPNEQFIPGMIGPRGKKWGSVWMEIGGLNSASGALAQPSADPAIGFLRESGYEEFPAIVGRWATTSRDVYGTGPGHDALPDAKQLMLLEKRSLLAISKGVNPPMLIPDTMRMQRISMLPGDPIYVPAGMQGPKVEPAQTVLPEFVNLTELKIRQTEERIGEAMFARLMLLFSEESPTQGKQPVTAQEIVAKRQEQLLQLGPVMENINDFLSHLVDRTAAIMERRGLVPPPPKEIQGMRLKVEFISVMAQAQKMLGINAKERLLAFVGQVGQLKGPEAADKINTFKLIDRAADDLGVPPDVILDDQDAAKLMQQRNAQAKAQQQGMAMAEAAKAAGAIGAGNMEGDNLLKRMIGPVGAAQAGEPGAGE